VSSLPSLTVGDLMSSHGKTRKRRSADPPLRSNVRKNLYLLLITALICLRSGLKEAHLTAQSKVMSAQLGSTEVQ
jgi:hypothetical protein